MDTTKKSVGAKNFLPLHKQNFLPLLESLKDWGVDYLLCSKERVTQHVNQSTSQPVNQSTSQPVNQSASQPVNQSTSQLVDQSTKSLQQLREEIGDCTRCKLHTGRTNLVFGVGNPNAKLMFVGEGPGHDEDIKGEPFVGRAGQLLTKMIQAMGFQRSDVYIANVVKCRPPNNRNPEPDEVNTCFPFLKKQIEIINPKVVVALGKFAAQTVLQTAIPITKLRGQFEMLGNIKIMPTYHPAFLLRNPEMKKFVWEDLKKVMAELGIM